MSVCVCVCLRPRILLFSFSPHIIVVQVVGKKEKMSVVLVRNTAPYPLDYLFLLSITIMGSFSFLSALHRPSGCHVLKKKQNKKRNQNTNPVFVRCMFDRVMPQIDARFRGSVFLALVVRRVSLPLERRPHHQIGFHRTLRTDVAHPRKFSKDQTCLFIVQSIKPDRAAGRTGRQSGRWGFRILFLKRIQNCIEYVSTGRSRSIFLYFQERERERENRNISRKVSSLNRFLLLRLKNV